MALSPYITHLLIIIFIYVILSASLNLALGYTGMLNLGHVAFYAIGAYASALLALNFGVPFWIGILVGGILAAFVGYLLAFPTIRLKGDYLLLGTLGFSIIVEAILKNWSSLTRGPLGLPGIPKPELFGFTFSSPGSYMLLTLVIMILSLVIMTRIANSPFGRLMKAVRDDELATKTLGKNTFNVKAKVLILSAFFAGIAGSMYAHYITFIDPTTFSIIETVLIISMVFIGGTSSIAGSVAGAILLVLLPEPLRFLPLPSALVGGIRQGLYAVLLIAVIRWRPQGLMGEDTLHKALRSVKRWRPWRS